jgi:hypothetical protein
LLKGIICSLGESSGLTHGKRPHREVARRAAMRKKNCSNRREFNARNGKETAMKKT